MKATLTIAVFLLMATQLAAQYKIKKILIEEEGYSVRIKFKPITDQITKEGLILNITPKSAFDLNEKFYNLSKLDGRHNYSDYENSRSSYFLKKQKKTAEKSDFNFLLEGIDYLYENDSITRKQYDDLYDKVISRFDYDDNTQELNKKRVIAANPYYIGGKHLSVFEFSIKNPTDKFQTIRTDFLIESGDQLLEPLSSDFLISALSNFGNLNFNKLQSLEGYNMPREIVVPPKSEVTKYFAVQPINHLEKKLIISSPDASLRFEWAIERQQSSISEKYTYYEFETNWYYGGISGNGAINFYCDVPSEDIFFNGGLIYIDENNLDEVFEMTTVSLHFDKLYFGKTKVIGSETLDIERNRRNQIKVKAEVIEGLEKEIEN